MNAPSEDTTRQIRAEAASWVARLHGPDRNAEVEAGLKRWLLQSHEHANAFKLATEVWQETADLPGELPPRGRSSANQRTVFARRGWAYAAAAAVVCLGFMYYLHLANGSTFTTKIGEQRTLTLTDGTRVELNTGSELVVKYGERTRTVVLQRGEAYFDVSRHKDRPFIVVAGDREVIALGTSFVVRHEKRSVTVTLLQGRVAVTPSAETPPKLNADKVEVEVLRVGERLRLDENSTAPVKDFPSLDKVTAWQRGQLIFEDTPLDEAVQEFNRYSATGIRFNAEDVRRIRVGGTFRVGDVSSFAHAVADSNQLEVIDRGGELWLTRIQSSLQ